MAARAIRVDPGDNVAVATEDINKDQPVEVGGQTLPAATDIPRNHKIALADIAIGERVIRYGEPIGVAAEAIARGAWIHTHNLKSQEG
jgi:altronate hydrolase